MKLPRSAPFMIASAGALALLGACHPAQLGHGKNTDDRATSVGARLECPDSEGDLKRVDAAADGRSCRYTDPQGREARLMLMDLAGKSPRDALAGTEGELKALLPAAAAAPTPPEPPAVGNTTSDDKDEDGDRHDHTRIDLPGIHIEANGDKHATIRAFGQTIEAHGKDAVIHGGWNGKEAVINAHDGGAEIRAGFFGQRSIDANYLLASDEPGPSGVRAAGYIAKGPVTGPLVVGVETSKVEGDSGRHHHDDEKYRDLRRLVDRNIHRG